MSLSSILTHGKHKVKQMTQKYTFRLICQVIVTLAKKRDILSLRTALRLNEIALHHPKKQQGRQQHQNRASGNLSPVTAKLTLQLHQACGQGQGLWFIRQQRRP